MVYHRVAIGSDASIRVGSTRDKYKLVEDGINRKRTYSAF
jgi:hypothetical protein